MPESNPEEPSVLRAIRDAVAAQPEDLELRCHLAQLLLDAARADEALVEARTVLESQPDHLGALRLAALAADQSGALSLALSYWRVVDALTNGLAVPKAEPTALDDPGPALEPPVAEFEDDPVTFDDVGGLDDVKRRLRAMFLVPLESPALREELGAPLGGGLLLYGPPGCGKTHVARALAGELGTRFLSVSLPDVLDMYLGSSEVLLHYLFERARASALVVLFFDEIDALGQSRHRLAGSAMRSVVVQLLTELDGIHSINDGILVLGATNQPWDLDAAIRRPGRFDRTLFVPPPDLDARVAILTVHLRSISHQEDVDVWDLAKRTAGFSGADLRAVIVDATQRALLDAVERGGLVIPVNHAHLIAAIRDRKPSPPAWLDLARNVVAFGNRNGEYDDLALYLRKKRRS